ncbi:MAG TPA: PhzF family phenazine biosynthesis protein [Gaiellaceae bacterium]|nr:PhzF family phenazine biosynthesis protein [Gaiellaceae bacterium]
MPSFRYVVADVFTSNPLEGNQLAVFTDAREIPEHRLQPLAREMAFSETVFVYPPEADGHARIRIFTPASELPFAGHPVLGTAFVLGTPMQLPEIWLETKQGIVPIVLERGDGGRLEFGRMSQPIPSIEPFAQAGEVLAALGGVEARAPVELYDNGVPHVLVLLESPEEVAALEPDFGVLKRFDVVGINCFAGSGPKWKTRMFAPAQGVDEDPATGSAAGPIAVHLARHGLIAFGDEIELTQGVEIGRPSKLYSKVEGSADSIERIEVGGSSVIVARGEVRLPS